MRIYDFVRAFARSVLFVLIYSLMIVGLVMALVGPVAGCEPTTNADSIRVVNTIDSMSSFGFAFWPTDPEPDPVYEYIAYYVDTSYVSQPQCSMGVTQEGNIWHCLVAHYKSVLDTVIVGVVDTTISPSGKTIQLMRRER